MPNRFERAVITPEKKETAENKTELEQAKHFWEIQLNNETLIESPQNPKCEFAVVVPVYAENTARILKQITSLEGQQGVDQSQFEVIYVVNNDLPDSSSKSAAIQTANKSVIEAVRNLSAANIFAIDKSSAGHEITDCNVGKARNRGVAEAGLRFFDNNKNGTIIQTDADTYFEDQHYLLKLKQLIAENPKAIGIAGGLIFEFSPDTNDEKEVAEIKEKMKVLVLQKKCIKLQKFLKHPELPSPVGEKSFSGANMISKSLETAAIGGLMDTNVGEDPRFGLDLEAYGAKAGKQVIGAKKDLKVVVALRESDRTGSSYKQYLDKIDLGQDNQVEILEEKYKALAEQVKERSGGQDFINNLNEIIDNIRIN